MIDSPNSLPRTAPALSRRHMPQDYSISLREYTRRGTSAECRIPDDFGPAQSMRGFEQTYRNIIDYIVRITYRIWEDRDVAYIGNTYSDTSQVFDDYGLQLGNRKIIADTHHTTAAFSDIVLLADEIIWAGNDEVGYHTSHRTIIRGTNDGGSKYGPATNQSVDILVIANCVALENEIFLEHVLYNNSSMLQQLGLKLPQQVAALVKTAPAGWPRDTATWKGLRGSANPGTPIHIAEPIKGFDVDRFARQTIDLLWNRKSLEPLASRYESDFTFHGATDRKFRGALPYADMLAALHAAFPDIEVRVDEVYWMGNEKDGFLTSERWSADATHAGAGLYGEPTGKSVQIWGITQHHIVNGRIVSEWMLFNELDLMMQIAAA